MAAISKFEVLDIWQLTRAQTHDFFQLEKTISLMKDYELRNQMSASSDSVMDYIAEGFERAGNKEFKKFLLVANRSNGEYRSQLYRCLDRKHIAKDKVDELYSRSVILGNQLMSFIIYLQNSDCKGQSRKGKDSLS